MHNHRHKTLRGGGALRWWVRWFKRPRHVFRTSLEQRLKDGVIRQRDTGCHVWTGRMVTTQNKKGGKANLYGAISTGTHRLAWELANGPIPAGLQVLHRCDNPRCCNPDHLFVGTQQDNMADMALKKRSRNRYTGPIAPSP
jgi:hypothetical protein